LIQKLTVESGGLGEKHKTEQPRRRKGRKEKK